MRSNPCAHTFSKELLWRQYQLDENGFYVESRSKFDIKTVLVVIASEKKEKKFMCWKWIILGDYFEIDSLDVFMLEILMGGWKLPIIGRRNACSD